MPNAQASIRSIFDQAAEIASRVERGAYLDEACSGAPEVRAQVEALLAAHAAAGSFLEAPPTSVASATEAARRLAPQPTLNFLSPPDGPDSLGRLGHYHILEVVGSGGFGVVLKARDEKLQRIVAVKTLAELLAASGAARQRFVREAIAAAAVRHENVVNIHAVDDGGPVPYLVMEYIDGESLEAKLKQAGSLELKEILRIGLQIAEGLAAAHKQGLVHRDVKPANILLENGVQRVKITDFGLARAADDASLTATGLIAGTPAYMSPEQARGEAVDHRSDLFSLGSVLYVMCTGQSAFRGSTTLGVIKRVCEEEPRPIRELNADIPEWLCAIVQRLHAKRTDDRYQTAGEAAEDLRRGLAQLQLGSPLGQESHLPATRKAGGTPAPRQRRWLAPVMAAALLLALTLSITEAGGVTHLVPTVIRIVTGEGTLLVETSDPDVKISIEGDGGLAITGAGPQEVHIRPGSYRVKAEKNGQPVTLDTELVTIARGGTEVVKVTLEAGSGAAPAPPQTSGTASEQDTAVSEASLREAIRLRPGNSETHKNLGQFLEKQNRLSEAEAAFREAIRLAPGEPNYHACLSAVLRKQPDRFSEGVEELELANRLGPDQRYILSSLGHAYARWGRWKEAAPLYRRASELEPTEKWVAFKSATLSLHLGDLENYRLACRRLLDADKPGDEDRRPYNTAIACLLAPDGIGQTERVRQIAFDRISPARDDRNAGNARALAELRAGQWRAAIEELSPPASKLGSHWRDPFPLVILAMAQQGSGDLPAAQQTLAKAKALHASTRPADQGRPLVLWEEWLQAEILLREAEELIAPQAKVEAAK